MVNDFDIVATRLNMHNILILQSLHCATEVASDSMLWISFTIFLPPYQNSKKKPVKVSIALLSFLTLLDKNPFTNSVPCIFMFFNTFVQSNSPHTETTHNLNLQSDSFP